MMPKRGETLVDLPEAEVVRLYTEELLSTPKIAGQFGCSVAPVRRVLRKHDALRPKGNIPGKAQPRFRADVDIDRAMEMYLADRLSLAEIAKAMGCSRPTIRRHLRRAGVRIRRCNETKKGARSPHRMRVDVGRAVALYEEGQTLAQVGAVLGVSWTTVRNRMAEAGFNGFRSADDYDRPTGPDHHRWRDDISDEDRVARRDTAAQAKWRMGVFDRDGFTCVVCGDDHGGNLNAHHLNSHDEYPAQRWDVNNGATLCEVCHADFHGEYGYGQNTAAQFEAFMGDRTRRAA